jgi:DNA polymerase-3 subunit gamma/tau
MSEPVFYRKYRPGAFGEVIGQDQIVKVLEGALKLGRVAHAYLFAGPRGTGKTSVARILAKALGCQPVDLVEIDAASSGRVDEIRELREGVSSLPFASPYKVYIIDEAHMITREGFNALLKTLEEPPPYVIFILATTEAERLPETIVSRCQTFQFQKPGLVDLKKFIDRISEKEKLKIDPAAAELIALLGDGSFRDTAGILQKAAAISADKKLSAAEIEEVTGAPPTRLIADFIKALVAADLPAALALAVKAGEERYQTAVFLQLVLRRLRLSLIAKLSPSLFAKFEADLAAEDQILIKEVGSQAGSEKLPGLLRGLLAAYETVRLSALPELTLELALAELLVK